MNKKNIFSFFIFPIAALINISAANAQDVLCPEPSETAMTAPADLAQVQSDIDRLALCVERAKLLADLDKTLSDREGKDKEDGALKPLIPMSPSAEDVSEIINTETVAVKNIPRESPLSSAGESEPKVKSYSAWQIRRIWGEKGNTKAQLAKTDGTVATVVQNDVLPDGYVVVSLSPMGITVKKEGKISELAWAEAEAGDTGK